MLLILPMLLIPSLGFSIVIPDTNYIDITYTLGQAQPSPITINFHNTENESLTLTLTKSGDSSSFFSLSTSSLSFSTNETKQVSVSFFIPNSTTPGVYTGNINLAPSDKVLYDTIPVFITVKSAQVSECRLYPEITSYTTRIQQGAAPFSQRFNVRVGSGCVNGVEITGVYLMDVIQTSEGPKPIRKIGGESLGFKQPGDTAFFNIEFDVSGMDVGTYTPYVKIMGIYNNEPISAEIHFSITVVSGPISPEINITTLPEWDIPSTVKVKETFKITVRNVNPNIQPYIFPNEKLFGEGVDVSGNQWIFRFRANETGSITIKYTTLYRGAQIGKVYEKTITVTGAGVVSGSPYLKFDFFPPVNEIRGRMTVSVLVRDNATNNIVPADIYLNGVKLEENVFTVEAGKTYHLTATHPDYYTLDYEFTVPKPSILIYVTPEKPEVGDIITITTKNSLTNEDIDAVVKWDGSVTPKTFTVQTSGNHTIEATASGFEPAKTWVWVEKALEITYAPEELALNKNATISFSRNTSYEVVYKKEKTGKGSVIKSGSGDTISFTPKEAGYYYIYAKGEMVKMYEVKPGFTLPNVVELVKQHPIETAIVIGGILVIIYLKFFKKQKVITPTGYAIKTPIRV